MDIHSFNKAIISRRALLHNFRLLQEKASPSAFLAMVKADAYGHGMLECSDYLFRNGCTIFGVAELGEAVSLRKNGISGKIFIMMGFDPQFAEAVVQQQITPVIYDRLSLHALSQAASKQNQKVAVHLKVDSGMNRLGIQLEQVDEFLDLIDTLPGVELEGVASHFPCADDRLSPETRKNYQRFTVFRERIANENLTYHIANSAGTLFHEETRRDMVRCGISLYGYYPDGVMMDTEAGLQPVMSFTTRVLQVKDVPQGEGISYGHTFRTLQPSRIAILPVGYEDGYSRKLSNCGEVIIRGRRAPVRGRVCMNMCMVDVTDIPGVETGDEVVILGAQGNETINADDLARQCGTISYEILCMIGNNNQREYI